MDTKSIETLEFPKVLERLAEYTSFSAGYDAALSVAPTTDLRQAQRWQTQTAEAIALLSGDSEVSIGGAKDVRRSAENAKRGFTLPVPDVIAIKDTLIASRTLKRNLLKKSDRIPELAEIAELIEEIPGLINDINQKIDERGEVADNATPTLSRLRQQLRTAHDRIQDRLRGLINSSASQYMQDPIITMRGGRYVIPLRAEFKGRIKGVVHDQSSSGATLFIEPLNTVELNNNYRSLQIEEQKEIERILAELSRQVAINGEELIRIVDRMAELDLIFARARYGMATDAVKPIFTEWRKLKPPHPGSTVWIRAARHPLLDPATVIPTDFLVADDIFTVLITGPNTGGKTVSLKNLGLMVIMAQSGLHVPANEARLTVFDNVFADIGDEQSIEQSLSTFSAHITNIIRILQRIDDRSLVVLDELGSGTDPTEGAAIAQAIINFLRDKGATSFIATHYPELKLYASQTNGATNASMMFDVETLSPTYELAIGIPGKSNALAIARRLGLDETILDDAMGLVGIGDREAEKLIDSIFDLREKISAEEAATRLARSRAEKERDQLRMEAVALEYERRKILEEAREQAEAELERVRNEIRRARKQLKDAQSLTAVKKVSKRMSEMEEGVQEPIEDLTLVDVAKEPKRRRNKRLEVGDTVAIAKINQTGVITNIQGKEAEIAVGRMTMRVRLNQLEFRSREEPEQEQRQPSYTPTITDISMELDLRGERVESGLQRLDTYLDAAAISDLPWARIIHGKGTGRLRQAVRRALGKHHGVKSWEDGKQGEGDDGVTVVRFKR